MAILIFDINGMLIYTSDVTYMHDVRLLYPSLVLEGCSSGLVRKLERRKTATKINSIVSEDIYVYINRVMKRRRS